MSNGSHIEQVFQLVRKFRTLFGSVRREHASQIEIMLRFHIIARVASFQELKDGTLRSVAAQRVVGLRSRRLRDGDTGEQDGGQESRHLLPSTQRTQPSASPGSSHSCRELLHRLERVGVRGGFIRPVALHPRETQGQSAGIPRADLNVAKRNLRHQLRLDIDGVTITRNFQLEKLRRLPCQHLVRKPLEGLAEHGEAAVCRIARAQV